MKRSLCTLLAALCLGLALTGCGSSAEDAPSSAPEPGPAESGAAQTVSRYIAEPIGMPEGTLSVDATYRDEDGGIVFVTVTDEFIENADGTITNLSTARLWRSSPGGEAELTATLYENSADRRSSRFSFAPDGTLWGS